MNIIDAAKSGKACKRKGWFYYQKFLSPRVLSPDDILADDWELEVVRKDLSAQDVLEAYDAAAQEYYTTGTRENRLFFDLFLKELGLT